MPERDEIIKGLRCIKGDFIPCDTCKYATADGYGRGNRCKRQCISDAIALLKEQKSEWLEDSDPGQEYGTTWACRKCMHSIHRPYAWNPYNSGYKYCPHCGSKMVVKQDG